MGGYGEDRRTRRGRRRRLRSDRRTRNLGAPAATAWGHFIDLIFFRLLGVALIANEVLRRGTADWHVLVAGFGAFFMPDWLRGRSSPFVRAILKTWVDGAANQLEHTSEALEPETEPPHVSHGRDGESP